MGVGVYGNIGIQLLDSAGVEVGEVADVTPDNEVGGWDGSLVRGEEIVEFGRALVGTVVEVDGCNE